MGTKLWHVGGLVLAMAPLQARASDSSLPLTFPAPDSRALVLISSFEDDEKGCYVRVVSLVDENLQTCVASFTTSPRHTRVFWNTAGTRCLVEDCPDDGNTFLRLYTRVGTIWHEGNLNRIMTELNHDFEAELSDGTYQGHIKIYRGGPMEGGISWIDANRLKIETLDATGRKKFVLTLNENGTSFSEKRQKLGGPASH